MFVLRKKAGGALMGVEDWGRTVMIGAFFAALLGVKYMYVDRLLLKR